MTKYAVIVTATGEVINMVEWDGVADYTPEEGTEAREATETAMIGGTWNGSVFALPVSLEISRLDILMRDEAPPIKAYDADTDDFIARPAEDIAADKAELLGLLQTKLADSGDLSWEEMNKMLTLEQES